MMRIFRGTAVLVLNTLLLFALVNGVLYLVLGPAKPEPWFVIVSRRPYSAQELDDAIDWFLRAHAWDRLERFYPRLTPREVTRLMVETYRPLLFEPFTQFKERPYRGQFVNVDERGFRLGREQGPWPPAPANLNVFAFGGSTTFGASLPDDLTIPSQLQALLSRRSATPVRVYNFGRGYYFSTQERVLFEQLLSTGVVPDVAVFVDGLNDYYFPRGEPAMTAELRRFVDLPPPPSRPLIEWYQGLPIGRAAARVREWARGRPAEVPPLATPPAVPGGTPARADALRASRVELAAGVQRRYIANKRMIDAIATAYGVHAVAVWQPVPKYKYDRSLHSFLVPDDRDPNALSGVFGYPEMAKLASTGALGRNFLWCADIAEHLREEVYLDQVHYTPRMSRRVARCIAKGMLRRGLIARRAAVR